MYYIRLFGTHHLCHQQLTKDSEQIIKKMFQQMQWIDAKLTPFTVGLRAVNVLQFYALLRIQEVKKSSQQPEFGKNGIFLAIIRFHTHFKCNELCKYLNSTFEEYSKPASFS